MKARKAVITAAAPDQHTLPLQRLVDREGEERSVLQLIVDEAIEAGIEEIAIVIQPGDATEYRRAAGTHVSALRFIEQTEPAGYADAVHRARDFVGDEPFLHLVGDHLYLSSVGVRCARQLLDVAAEHVCAVSAVQATREHRLPFFGAVGGTRVPRSSRLYEISKVIEKPTPTQAEQELVVAGLRPGTYLCFFGMHVLPAEVMDSLGAVLAERVAGERPSLTAALARWARGRRYLALEVEGVRHNLGVRYGLLMTQLALALSGKDREQVLSELVELLATRPAVHGEGGHA